ncbi:hypothetical protein VB776_23705 [Arcicella sp. DC2W]|uniref:Uncharacterized protein n=1 Tax=Arcicella gelida TaxID=2984195 RepID=A0ABU5SBY3_9BACT|nr:hypothetical protein [Arcicella sp. DC2W]MEA5405965.1 hypothetical protein [Arcicella sp. DC2W]
MIEEIFIEIENIIEKSFKDNFRFGYKERIILERNLFALILRIGKSNNFEINSFSSSKLNEYLLKLNDCNSDIKLMRDIFEIKIFLQKLSSTSSYVQGDLLFNLGLTKKSTYPYILKKINKIKKGMADY